MGEATLLITYTPPLKLKEPTILKLSRFNIIKRKIIFFRNQLSQGKAELLQNST